MHFQQNKEYKETQKNEPLESLQTHVKDRYTQQISVYLKITVYYTAIKKYLLCKDTLPNKPSFFFQACIHQEQFHGSQK